MVLSSFLSSGLVLSCLSWLALLVVVDAQNCKMDIWVFATMEQCEGLQPPNAVGTLYADGTCQTVETDTAITSSDYRFLPGTYSAECTSEGKIRFIESGCVNSDCSGAFVGADVCDRDISTEAALFSRLSPPEFNVQKPSDATGERLYSCSRLRGTDITVTFTIFGDCSDPACIGGETDPPISSPTTPEPTPEPVSDPDPEPTPQPTPKPTRSPTLRPTIRETTPSPTAEDVIVTLSPTRKPTISPTDPPTPSPTDPPIMGTTAPATPSPTTRAPTTLAPTSAAPVTEAPIAPGAPTRAPTISLEPTIKLTSSPTNEVTSSPTPDVVTQTTRVGMYLSEITGLFTVQEARAWETYTAAHVQQTAKQNGINVANILVSDILQEVLNQDGDILISETIASLATRSLQDTEYSLNIYFTVSIDFLDPPADDNMADKTFRNAFDTEVERAQYLIKLVSANDAAFSKINQVRIIDDGFEKTYSPTIAPTTKAAQKPTGPIDPLSLLGEKEPEKKGSTLGIIIGVVVGALCVVCIVGFFLYRRGKHDALSEKEEPIVKELPSNTTGTSPVAPVPQPQRWTNEITVDPQVDDVSTLGGSILAGLHLVEGGPDDEHTASVNVDYDYAKHYQQYRNHTEESVSDTRSRSVADTSQPTNFSKWDMGGSLFTDDMSFERQYGEGEGDEDDSLFKGDDVSNSKPFEVRAPPGMLGMVVDTPKGGVPIVRAIKNSSVLFGQVKIGDKLVAVDSDDVTRMSAIQVSSLISTKSHLHRTLVFVRPRDRYQSQSGEL